MGGFRFTVFGWLVVVMHPYLYRVPNSVRPAVCSPVAAGARNSVFVHGLTGGA